MPRGEKKETWSPDKRARFVRDWREGLSFDALREKYGVRRPSATVQTLRRSGYVLESRRGRKVVA